MKPEKKLMAVLSCGHVKVVDNGSQYMSSVGVTYCNKCKSTSTVKRFV